jgi:hypothetical protein
MTRLQIISFLALIAAAVWTYLPLLKITLPSLRTPGKSPDTLGHMRNVMAVRDAYEAAEVKNAATALLQSLLQVK